MSALLIGLGLLVAYFVIGLLFVRFVARDGVIRDCFDAWLFALIWPLYTVLKPFLLLRHPVAWVVAKLSGREDML